MKTPEFSIGLTNPEEDAIEKAVSLLLSGGIVLYPSDTVYGILCRADRMDSVKRLAKIKGYDRPRPFILIVDGLSMAESLTDGIDPEVREILLLRWPGRLTFVLPAGNRCPEWVRGKDNTVALRHPADALSEQLLKRCGIPLVSTSANHAGEDSSLSISAIPDNIISGVDIVLNAGDLPQSSPSTIIKVLRQE
ncbi:MAG: threonylcarbamoyl-AMP synthase [Candidatus Fermentibacteraceae bacterium]|nr:threonylcarbamoyl-AMP synthase [Candidatus Fermentibacteraceae bacterium]